MNDAQIISRLNYLSRQCLSLAEQIRTRVEEPRNEDIGVIIQAVADHYKVTVKEILAKQRANGIADSRHMAMYLAREAKHSLQSVAIAFNRLDHATVSYAVAKIEDLIEIKDRQTLDALTALKRKTK
jgi:chromosomal replication initiation ATPase DnaA